MVRADAMEILGGLMERRDDAAPVMSAGLAARVPAPLVVLGGVVSVQIGQALGKGLMGAAGPLGVATVRLVVAAVLMLLIWRPAVPRAWRELRLVPALGTAIAGMSISYLAMERLPFGVAMTLQLLGPIGVALALSRRVRDLAWAVLAAGSVLLFADPWSSAGLPSAAGLAFGLASAVAMALFLVLSGRMAARSAGNGGLALATAWAALLYLPLGLLESGPGIFGPWMVGNGSVVAALSAVVPYALTIAALRRLPLRVVGVLQSLEPVAAGLAGLVVLGERMSVAQWIAIGGITAASAGTTWSAPRVAADGASTGEGQRADGGRGREPCHRCT